MKKFILVLFLLASVANMGQAQQDIALVKLGGGVYFLQNKTLQEIFTTKSFFVPSAGLEIRRNNLGFFFELGGFKVNKKVDSTLSKNDVSLSQFFINIGMLHRIPLTPKVAFRGKVAISGINSNDSLLSSATEGLDYGVSFGAGFNFQATHSWAYFTELNYLHSHSKTLGQLGGLKLEFGVRIGGPSRNEKTKKID